MGLRFVLVCVNCVDVVGCCLIGVVLDWLVCLFGFIVGLLLTTVCANV